MQQELRRQIVWTPDLISIHPHKLQVLYLQLDNYYKEKNWFLLAFCFLLVELHVFQKVTECLAAMTEHH